MKARSSLALLVGKIPVVAGSGLLSANKALSAAVRPVAVACSRYPTPGVLIWQPAKVATPAVAAFDRPPVQVSTAPAVPVPEVIDSVMDAVEPVTVFPFTS